MGVGEVEVAVEEEAGVGVGLERKRWIRRQVGGVSSGGGHAR